MVISITGLSTKHVLIQRLKIDCPLQHKSLTKEVWNNDLNYITQIISGFEKLSMKSIRQITHFKRIFCQLWKKIKLKLMAFCKIVIFMWSRDYFYYLDMLLLRINQKERRRPESWWFNLVGAVCWWSWCVHLLRDYASM